MTLIPITALAPCELLALGNNLPRSCRRTAKRPDPHLDPIHRSLNSIGEDVEWFPPETPPEVVPEVVPEVFP